MSYLEGLDDSSIDTINKRIQDVVESSATSVREIVVSIRSIRNELDKGGEQNWMDFCSSGELQWGARTIRDYEKAFDWVSKTKVSDEVLGRLSVRSMALLASIESSKLLREIENKMTKENGLSQADITLMIGGNDSQKDSKPVETKADLKAERDRLKDRLVDAIEEIDFWKGKVRTLEGAYELQRSDYVPQSTRIQKRFNDYLTDSTVAISKKKELARV